MKDQPVEQGSAHRDSPSPEADQEELVLQRTAELEAANKELQEIKTQFEAVYNHHYQMTGLIDREGRLLMANRTALEFAGVAQEDVIGKPFWETPWWTHSQEARRQLREAMDRALQGEANNFESTHISATGETRVVDFRIRPVFGDDSEVCYLVPEGYDITDRKAAEKALRRSETRYRASVENAADAFFLVNKEGRILDVNKRACTTLGYSHEELMSMRVTDVEMALAEGDVATFWSRLDADDNQGEPLTLEGNQRRKDGTTFPVEVRAGLLELDDETLMLALVRDVTERKRAEEELHDREAMIGALVETSQDWIWALDLNGRHTYSNHAIEKILGYTPDEFRGAGLDLLHPEDRKVVDTQWPEWVEARQGWQNLVLRWRTRNGYYRYLESTAVPILSPEGEMQGFRGVDRDITDRKEAEESLRRQADLDRIGARILGRFAGSSAAEVDDCIETSLKEMAQFAGVETAYVIVFSRDRTAWSVAHAWVAEGCPDYRADYQNVPMGEGPWSEAMVLAGDIVSVSCIEDFPAEAAAERHRFKRDGVRSELTVPFHGRGGQIVGCMGFRSYEQEMEWASGDQPRLMLVGEAISNVLDRKHAEESLQQSEERYRGLVGTMQDIVHSVSADGTILFIGPQVERYGFTAEELVSQPFIKFISPEDRDAVLRSFDHTLATGEQALMTFRLASKDGAVVWFEEIGQPVRNAAGQIVSISGMLRDVTERKEAEEEQQRLEAQLLQAQKMEAVGRLAGGVAHDFNNLLMAIMNYADLCSDELDDDHPAHEWLHEISVESQRSANIVRQLLAFARKEAITPQVLDLSEAVTGMLRLLRRLIGEDMELVWIPGANVWPVKMDPGHVDQLLANLCVNARDAISGAGRVTVEAKNTTIGPDHHAMCIQAPPGEYVVLTVTDTGCGMDETTLEHVFEPFFTTKEVGRGTGLGLATVHGIVTQYGGGLDVTSEVGVGTTFRIYLPRTTSTEAPEELIGKDDSESLRGTETVLLVEDEKSLRVTSQLALEAFGYTVLTAGMPEKAIQLCSNYSGRIDLLITDVVMPGMTGYELAECLTQSRTELKCLFVSGYTAEVIADRVTSGIGAAFLGKPFTRDDLAREVRRILDE